MRRGFTLIELIITMAVIGIIAGVGAPMLVLLFDSFQYSLYGKDLTERGEVALRRMDREIRRLRNSTSVLTANSTTYQFVDVDGSTIQYQYDAANDEIERTAGANTDVLSANVTSFTLTYLGDDRATTIATPTVNPNATDIKFVRIDMTLSERGNTFNYRLDIKLQNVIHKIDLFQ
jgi:prepilin-type N-terminal cleavage/methylation domain-containing protein